MLGREVTAAVVPIETVVVVEVLAAVVVPIETAGVVDVLAEAVEVASDEVASVNAAARPILRRSSPLCSWPGYKGLR